MPDPQNFTVLAPVRSAHGEPEPTGGSPGGFPSSVVSVDATPPQPEVYRDIARAMLPRWRRVLAGASSRLSGRRSAVSGRQVFHATASALAGAVWCESNRTSDVDRAIQAAVDETLVGWQLSHLGNGRPTCRALRRDPLIPASTYHVVALLTDYAGYQTRLLLDDLAAHLQWLVSSTVSPDWIEARVVSSLADGGVLLRQRKFIEAGERRARALIGDGGTPGWTGKASPGDLSLVSAALDPLARTYARHGWDFLREPLIRMSRLLVHLTDGRGMMGGIRNVLHLPFPLTFGPELLLKHGLICTDFVARGRKAAGRIDARALLSWGEDLVAIAGPSVAMSLMAGAGRANESVAPVGSPGAKEVAGNGLSVFRTGAYDAMVDHTCGGALRIGWARTGVRQEDHGLRVVVDRRSLTSKASGACLPERGGVTGLTVSGAFVRDRVAEASGLAAAAQRSRVGRGDSPRRRGWMRGGDRFTRTVRFDDTRVTIIDAFELRHIPELVFVGAGGRDDDPACLGENPYTGDTMDALVLEETKAATVTRVFEHGALVRRTVAPRARVGDG